MQVWKILLSPLSQQMLKMFSKTHPEAAKNLQNSRQTNCGGTKEAKRALQEVEGNNRLPIQEEDKVLTSSVTQHEVEDK